jgi:ATP-dependent helicase/nuclease subunit A
VSANAGSGKTTVLTSRVVRLLLAGADPARILCVTYTKAAAANMQDKIFKALSEWVALDDALLSKAITEMTGERPREHDLKKARRLFAQAVETPGGLKIQTIHGFCERILHLFPFEAAVPARFKVLDDVEQSAITESIISETLMEALADPTGPLGRALEAVNLTSSESGFREALRAFMIYRRDMPRTELEAKFAQSEVRTKLGLKPEDTLDSVDRKIINDGLYSANWEEIVTWLNGGTKTDKERAAKIKTARRTQGSEDVEGYVYAFLKTSDDQPLASLATKKLKEDRPDLEDNMIDEQARIFDLWQQRKNIATAERTEAISILADHINRLYRTEKRRLGRLDFADLIGKVVTLLTSDTARWVLYKLDQGLDHVLVDEAQDTSPEQWEIVKAIADDFYAGASAYNKRLQRTIFAVGDEKQSIFGFNGAKPDEFAKARGHFEGQIKAYNKEAEREHHFETVPLTTSYRTVDDILSAVDQVFSFEENYQGIDSNNQPTVHQSNRQNEPGLVEFWPTIVGEKMELPNATDPVDSIPVDAPPRLLAKRIAKRIDHWLKTKSQFEDDSKLITPGDILVLVRSRGPIFESVIKALKEQNIPVAGADRMKLNEQIAVLDLLALGRFCLLPDDDLSLAAILKSPLFALEESDLLKIANGRGEMSLWASLCHFAQSDQRYAATTEELQGYLALAKRETPYHFYMHCLSVKGGRRKLVSRIGPDAEEAITIFLSQLRQWQASNPPSLLAFIEALAASESDVKRDMEEAHGRVRVMTVHASKGLEARIVFLVDLFHKAGGSKGPRLVELEKDNRNSAIWVPSKKKESQLVLEALDRVGAADQEESRRLLYVALTRAKDRLYIAGAHGVNAPPKVNWHQIIETSLKEHEHITSVAGETGEAEVQRWMRVPRRTIKLPEKPAEVSAIQLPDWLHLPAPNDLPRPPPLRPSRLVDAAEPMPLRDGITARAEARLRGDLIHHLLQHLPGIEAARWHEIAEGLSKAKFPSLEAGVKDDAIRSVIGLISDPSFAALFTRDARAEVDIAGRIIVDGKSLEVAGRIDRIAITPDEIILVDYKTGRAPADPNDIPQSHLKQLSVYGALLRDLYPDRVIKTAILWTALPQIVFVPAEKLNFAFQQIKAA